MKSAIKQQHRASLSKVKPFHPFKGLISLTQQGGIWHVSPGGRSLENRLCFLQKASSHTQSVLKAFTHVAFWTEDKICGLQITTESTEQRQHSSARPLGAALSTLHDTEGMETLNINLFLSTSVTDAPRHGSSLDTNCPSSHVGIASPKFPKPAKKLKNTCLTVIQQR